LNKEIGVKEMLSRDCYGCSQRKVCSKRYAKVAKGEKVYCPDGTVHLVDEDTITQDVGLVEHQMEMPQLV